MIMPPSWKAEIDKTVIETTAAFADAQESASKQSQKIATHIEALTDELKRRNAKQEADEPQKRTRENRTIAGLMPPPYLLALWPVSPLGRFTKPGGLMTPSNDLPMPQKLPAMPPLSRSRY